MKTPLAFKDKPVEVLTLIVLALTGAVLVWYSVETHLLRKATQEQLIRSYMPIVVIGFKKPTAQIIGRGFNLLLKTWVLVQLLILKSAILRFRIQRPSFALSLAWERTLFRNYL